MKKVDPETLKHNLTLTPREEKIILIKYIIHGMSPFREAPLETRIKMLQAAARICGYGYDDNEFQELGRACLATQEKVNHQLESFLHKDKDLYRTVEKNIKAGNDAIISVVDPYLQKGLKKLGLDKNDKESLK